MIEHMPAPGQRLIAHQYAAPGGPLAQVPEIVDDPFPLPQRGGRAVGTDQDAIGAQFAHQIELSLGPVEGALAQRARHPLEIAEGLVEHAGKAQIVQHAPHVSRRQFRPDQVILEYLDPGKAGRRSGAQFLFERAAQRDGGDGVGHGGSP